MKLKLRGKSWSFLRQRAGLGAGNVGHCDPPDATSKRIIVSPDLNGVDELEIIIHECLHAMHWDLDERAVKQTAEDMAAALQRIGYRKQ